MKVARGFGCVLTVAFALSVSVAQFAQADEADTRSFPGCPRLNEGDRGPCVKQLQVALNTVNSGYHLDPDEKFGAATRIAVLDFQGRNHLGADGRVGGRTADELQRQVKALNSAPPAQRTVRSPRYQVVRYIHDFSVAKCSGKLLQDRIFEGPLICEAIQRTHNPEPGPDVAATPESWDAFWAAQEYRGVVDLPSHEITCDSGGKVIGTAKELGEPRISAGWTPVRLPGKTLYLAGEKYHDDGGSWYNVDPQIQPAADGRSVHLTYKVAARAGTSENAGTGALTGGRSLPFIWTVVQTDLRCDGSSPTTVTYSQIPSTVIYKNGREVASLGQSDDWGRFIRSGGNAPLNGSGKLYNACGFKSFDFPGGRQVKSACSDYVGSHAIPWPTPL